MATPTREISVTATLALLLAGLAWFAPAFFSQRQLLPWLTGVAPILVLASGMMFVIVGRQIDISIGSQFAWCSVVAGLAAGEGWPLPAVWSAAILAGLAFGTLNGALIAFLELPSIVVTLATMVTARETLRWWREGEFVRDLPESFQWFGLTQSQGQWTVMMMALALWAALAWASRHLPVCRWIYAVGSNAEAARLAGIQTRWVTCGIFAFMGLLTGVAGVLNAARFSDVDPKTGTGIELQTIAAVVVGGVSISGGKGRLWGVLAGVLLLASLAPALVFLKWPPQWEKAIQGAVLLLAVAAEGLQRNRPTRTTREH